jgi:hypothetical protein
VVVALKTFLATQLTEAKIVIGSRLYNRKMHRAAKSKRVTILIALVLATLTLPAHARGKDFTRPSAQPAKTYPFHDDHAADKVAIAADPYDTPGKAKIFNLNYADHDLLPIFVVITNDGERPISIASLQITLTTAGRSKLTPLTIDDVLRRFGNAHPNLHPIPVPIPQKKVKGGLSQRDRDEIATAQFAAKAVEPHSTQSGFLFFDIEGIASPLEAAHLYLEGVNDAAGTELMYFEIGMEK